MLVSLFFRGLLIQQRQRHPPARTQPPAVPRATGPGHPAPGTVKPVAQPGSTAALPGTPASEETASQQLGVEGQRGVQKHSVLIEAPTAGPGSQPRYLPFRNKKVRFWHSPRGIDFPGRRGFASRNFGPLRYFFS